MADPNELKILVKKSDGSYVHVPISELQKKGAGNAPQLLKPAQKPITVSAPVASTKSNEPIKSSTEKPKEATPTVKPTIQPTVKQPEQKKPEISQIKTQPAAAAMPEKKPEIKTAPPPNLPVEVKEELKPVLPEKNTDLNKLGLDQKENERLERELPAVVISEKKEAKKEIGQKQVKNENKIQPPKSAIIEKPQPLKVEMDKSDAVSLLEEELPVVSKLAPLTSVTREKQVEEILKNLSFKIPQGNESRFRTIVQLFLKEVRGEVETKEILERSDLEGGVGLSGSQAAEVVEKCKKTTLPAMPAEPVPSLKLAPKPPLPEPPAPKEKPIIKAPSDSMEIEKVRLEKELPMIKNTTDNKLAPKPAAVKVEMPAVEKTVVPEKKPQPPSDARKRLEEQITRATLAETGIQNFKLNSERNRTVMQDVKAAPVQMGPIDEIRYFSLTDFRRLSADPAEAAKRLKQKFINLAEESILLFFEALEAWKSSPLHHEYLKLVSEALLKKRPLIQVATDKTRIQIAEITAIIQMERELD